MTELPKAPAGSNPPEETQDGLRLTVLLALIVVYCLVPVGSLAAALWIMFSVSANYFIENGDFVSLVTWLATEPSSSIGILQQLIAPIAAAITGAALASLRHRWFITLVVAVCCLGIVCALVVSTLFQLRSVLPNAGTLGAIQTYFHGIASTLGVYVLFLLGIAGGLQAKTKETET